MFCFASHTGVNDRAKVKVSPVTIRKERATLRAPGTSLN